ncbi:uncharacterized protein LOC132904180 [Amyelois transitella]|uniref:uncharacterized protein LOC132904180 n=1 Tax=Amyelois transitella TaxID=680683 RepID=UPI00298FB79B|nr:uncharacterized protein LOC132904180 [Amyelois transitella]
MDRRYNLEGRGALLMKEKGMPSIPGEESLRPSKADNNSWREKGSSRMVGEGQLYEEYGSSSKAGAVVYITLIQDVLVRSFYNNVALVRASHQLTGGGPSNVRPLTEIEEKFLVIVGQDFGTGLPGIRVQPNFEREPIEPQPVASNRILTPTIEEATQEFGQDKRNLPNEDEAQDGGSLSVLEYWEEMNLSPVRRGS